MHPFRVFISYARKDERLAEQLATTLEEIGLKPVWDAAIQPGTLFTNAIQEFIATAHIFMPLITETAKGRAWVLQETGYAVGLNLPVLPVAIGVKPGAMLAGFQTITGKRKDLENRLRKVPFERLVLSAPVRNGSTFMEVGEWPEERAKLLGEYANQVIEREGYVQWRQLGALSSFCIPDADLDDSIWKQREGTLQRSDYYHHLQREERRVLEKHARAKGCRLIVYPDIDFDEKQGRGVSRTRLSILDKALKSLPDDKVEVYILDEAKRRNLTIVGDWFAAESRLPRPGGYRYTVFTWHAPTVYRWRKQFDREFDELSTQKGQPKPKKSSKAAREEINRLIEYRKECERKCKGEKKKRRQQCVKKCREKYKKKHKS